MGPFKNAVDCFFASARWFDLWSSSWALSCITGVGSEPYVLFVGGYYINHICTPRWLRANYAAGTNTFQNLLRSKVDASLQQPLLLQLKQGEPAGYFWGSFTVWYFLQWVRVFLFYSLGRDLNVPARGRGQGWSGHWEPRYGTEGAWLQLMGSPTVDLFWNKSLQWLLLLSVRQCLLFHVLPAFLSRFVSLSRTSLYVKSQRRGVAALSSAAVPVWSQEGTRLRRLTLELAVLVHSQNCLTAKVSSSSHCHHRT